jgi:cob(I)alamin adenosyltransferase
MTAAQCTRLEEEIDTLNSDLQPLRSFVLPGGHAAAALPSSRAHRRTPGRARDGRIEGRGAGEHVSPAAITYINRLSDFLFVASRWVNARTGKGDILWVPGQTRS